MKTIEAHGLSKSYGAFRALDSLDIAVEDGEIFGFLGPNGAGKTTTIKLLTGQMNQDAGSAEVLGIDTRHALEIKRVIGIVPEVVLLPSFLTTEEYLGFVCALRKIGEERIGFWLDFAELHDRRETLCKDLSLGMKQKLSFAAAFMHQPRLVFLDEPFADVDPLMQNKMKAFLKDYVNNGGTVFLSTHILEIAQKLCSRIAIINKGTLIRTAGIAELLQGGHDLEDTFIDLVRGHG